MSDILLCKFDFEPNMSFIDFSQRVEDTKIKTSYSGFMKATRGARKMESRRTGSINTNDKTTEARIKSTLYSLLSVVYGNLVLENVSGCVTIAICAEMVLGKIRFVGRPYVQDRSDSAKKQTA